MESGDNPYQSPAADLANAREFPRESQPSYKLFSIRAITVATVLGSPIAGGIVMAINYRRLGRSMAAVHSVIWTIVATVMILVVGGCLPEDIHIPNSVFIVPQIFVMYGIAKELQGHAIETHEQRGGQRASAWAAAGIGVVTAAILLAAIFAAVLAQVILSPE